MESHCRLEKIALANVVCMLIVSSMYPTCDIILHMTTILYLA